MTSCYPGIPLVFLAFCSKLFLCSTKQLLCSTPAVIAFQLLVKCFCVSIPQKYLGDTLLCNKQNCPQATELLCICGEAPELCFPSAAPLIFTLLFLQPYEGGVSCNVV